MIWPYLYFRYLSRETSSLNNKNNYKQIEDEVERKQSRTNQSCMTIETCSALLLGAHVPGSSDAVEPAEDASRTRRKRRCRKMATRCITLVFFGCPGHPIDRLESGWPYQAKTNRHIWPIHARQRNRIARKRLRATKSPWCAGPPVGRTGCQRGATCGTCTFACCVPRCIIPKKVAI